MLIGACSETRMNLLLSDSVHARLSDALSDMVYYLTTRDTRVYAKEGRHRRPGRLVMHTLNMARLTVSRAYPHRKSCSLSEQEGGFTLLQKSFLNPARSRAGIGLVLPSLSVFVAPAS